MPTEALLQHVSEYLEDLTTIILGESGTVDKYIGDCIMASGARPRRRRSRIPRLPGRAAVLPQARHVERQVAGEGKPALRTRFGINSGEVSVGNVGCSEP